MDLKIEIAQTARVEIIHLEGRLTVGDEVKALLARFERFNGIAPSVPVHMLTVEFCAQEPSLAGPALLEQIRGLIS